MSTTRNWHLAGEGRPRATRAGGGQPRGQCARCDAQWRLDHASARATSPPRRKLRRYTYTGMPRCGLRAGRSRRHRHGHAAPRSWKRSSSRSSRPRNWGRAPVSVCRRSTASSSRPAASSIPSPKWASGTVFKHLPAAPRGHCRGRRPRCRQDCRRPITVVKDLTGHERILLVEDEDNVRAFSARALRATGYEVFEAD